MEKQKRRRGFKLTPGRSLPGKQIRRFLLHMAAPRVASALVVPEYCKGCLNSAFQRQLDSRQVYLCSFQEYQQPRPQRRSIIRQTPSLSSEPECDLSTAKALDSDSSRSSEDAVDHMICDDPSYAAGLQTLDNSGSLDSLQVFDSPSESSDDAVDKMVCDDSSYATTLQTDESAGSSKSLDFPESCNSSDDVVDEMICDDPSYAAKLQTDYSTSSNFACDPDLSIWHFPGGTPSFPTKYTGAESRANLEHHVFKPLYITCSTPWVGSAASTSPSTHKA